jgi:DNA polymerase-3 subunit gamma/tau
VLLSRLDALLAGQPQPLNPEPEPVPREPVAVSVKAPTPGTLRQEATPALPASGLRTGYPEHDGTAAGPGGAEPSAVAGPILSEGDDGGDEAEEPEPPPSVPAGRAPLQPKVRDVRRDWDAFIEHVRERKKWMAGTLSQADKVKEEGEALVIQFDEASECHMLQEAENRKLLTEFAQDFFQKELAVRIVVAGESAGGELGQPQEERRALANDPRVQIALEVLGGSIAGVRTGPRSR